MLNNLGYLRMIDSWLWTLQQITNYAPPKVKTLVKVVGGRHVPCTVDGYEIFQTRKDLIAKLGKGENGLRHPNFHYVPDDGVYGNRCTVDGHQIFESRKTLIAKLGKGKAGLRHPNFHYVNSADAE